jgi:ankyrin repeat protein
MSDVWEQEDDEDEDSDDDFFFDDDDDEATDFDHELYEMLEMEAPLEEIRPIVFRRPHSVRWVSFRDGENAFHLASRRSGGPDLVRFLWQEWPESVRVADASGRLALHHAASADADLRTIEFLVERNPGSVQERDDKGRIPLHYAVQRKKSLRILEYLVGRRPESIREVDSDGRTVLHLAFTECWSYSPTVPLIEYLIRRLPEAIRQTDRNGNLPLHVAAREVSDPRVLRLLVDPWPESVREATAVGGRLPLHIAASSSIGFRASVQFYLNLWPESIRAVDSNGNLPLHVAAATSAGADEIRPLLQAWPPSVQARNASGLLPLHFAVCRPRNPSIRVVRLLLNEHPPSARATDLEGGSTPLHLAATGGRGSLPSVHEPDGPITVLSEADRSSEVLEIVKLLAEQASESVQMANRQGFLPLHVAAATDAALDVVFTLATAWPEAVSGTLNTLSRSSEAPSASLGVSRI